MHARTILLTILCLGLFLAPVNALAVKYVQAPPLAEVVKQPVGEVVAGGPVTLPLITWGGDIATILANGNAAMTAPNSILAREKLQFKLKRMDDFKEQVGSYLKGETPYLRGTMGMINMAAEVLNRDPRTRPVIVYQLTWSNGGDCLVVKDSIKTARDLKGKTVALQAYGPHVDYLAKLLADAGLAMSEVTIKWTSDLTGSPETPAEALSDAGIDAAMVIIPDGLMLSSGGTVGTGAEGSVKGARIMLSTKSANRIINDVYAVRADYLERHRDKVKGLVHGLLQADQELAALFKARKQRLKDYEAAISAAAAILLDSKDATGDAEALYGDCEFAGYGGNVRFFGDAAWPRNFANLSREIQSALVTVGLLGRTSDLAQAQWNYDELKAGLGSVDDVEAPRFKSEVVAQVVAQKQAMGTLGEGELFSFEVFFQPNQNNFSADQYSDAFAKVIELASTYGGAVITVEGHSDPMGYLRKQKEKESEIVLRRTMQAAKNLSLTRAIAVRDSMTEFAVARNISLDPSQFTVVGHGIMQPRNGMCGELPCAPKTKEEWLANMRVVFRIIQIEAEDSAFMPID